MQIDIQARDFPLTEGIREHVESRVRFSLTRFRDRLHRVNVRLSDVNGPRGGVDKRCRVHLRVEGLPDIVIDDIEQDLYAAISRSTGRAERTLGRQLHRARGEFDPRSNRIDALIDA